MKVSSIVVTYNGSKWIEKCLSCLENSSISNHHIIVIDNGSNDNTVKIINSLFPAVKLIESKTNLGFGGANNIGLELAIENNSDYVFLLNQDAWVEHNTIENLINFQKLNTNFGILSPIHFDGRKRFIDKNFFSYLQQSNSFRNIISDLITGDLAPVYEVNFVNAAIWLISKKCLKKTGFFDRIFFHYGEDRNFAQRVLYHGFKIGIMANQFGCHDREESGDKITLRKYKFLSMAFMLVKICDVNNKNIYLSYLKYFGNRLYTIYSNILEGNIKFIFVDINTMIMSVKLFSRIKKSQKINRMAYSK